MRKSIITFLGVALQSWASKLEAELILDEAKIEGRRMRITVARALGQQLLAMAMPRPVHEPEPEQSEARTH